VNVASTNNAATGPAHRQRIEKVMLKSHPDGRRPD
jgi:hypothetical protein